MARRQSLESARRDLEFAKIKSEMEFLTLARRGNQFDPRFQGGIGGTNAEQRAAEALNIRRAGTQIRRGGGRHAQSEGSRVEARNRQREEQRRLEGQQHSAQFQAERGQSRALSKQARDRRLAQGEATRNANRQGALNRAGKLAQVKAKARGRSSKQTGGSSSRLSPQKAFKLAGDINKQFPSKRFFTEDELASVRRNAAFAADGDFTPDQLQQQFAGSLASQLSNVPEGVQRQASEQGISPFALAATQATGEQDDINGLVRALNNADSRFEMENALSQQLTGIGFGDPEADRQRKLQGVLAGSPRLSQHPAVLQALEDIETRRGGQQLVSQAPETPVGNQVTVDPTLRRRQLMEILGNF